MTAEVSPEHYTSYTAASEVEVDTQLTSSRDSLGPGGAGSQAGE